MAAVTGGHSGPQAPAEGRSQRHTLVDERLRLGRRGPSDLHDQLLELPFKRGTLKRRNLSSPFSVAHVSPPWVNVEKNTLPKL